MEQCEQINQLIVCVISLNFAIGFCDITTYNITIDQILKLFGQCSTR